MDKEGMVLIISFLGYIQVASKKKRGKVGEKTVS